MARTQYAVPFAALQSLIDDPERGTFSLVGTFGGLSLITGEINASDQVFGRAAVETEHGTIYLDPDFDVRVSEDDGQTLMMRETEFAASAPFTINTALGQILASHFNWSANSESAIEQDLRDGAFNDVVLNTCAQLDDLLAAHPAEAQALAEHG